jgi:hypothetical protein
MLCPGEAHAVCLPQDKSARGLVHIDTRAKAYIFRTILTVVHSACQRKPSIFSLALQNWKDTFVQNNLVCLVAVLNWILQNSQEIGGRVEGGWESLPTKHKNYSTSKQVEGKVRQKKVSPPPKFHWGSEGRRSSSSRWTRSSSEGKHLLNLVPEEATLLGKEDPPLAAKDPVF